MNIITIAQAKILEQKSKSGICEAYRVSDPNRDAECIDTSDIDKNLANLALNNYKSIRVVKINNVEQTLVM